MQLVTGYWHHKQRSHEDPTPPYSCKQIDITENITFLAGSKYGIT